MNDTIRAILDLLEEDKTPDLKIAAVQVLGELGPKDAAVVKGMTAALTRGGDFLVRPILAALASIGSAAAIRTLVGELETTERADLAALHLIEVGDAAAAPLAAAFDGAGPEARTRIVGILGKLSGKDARQVLEKALLEADLSRRAGDALVQTHLQELDKRSAQALKARLTKTLRDDELAPQCVATLLKVLVGLDAAGSRPTLLKHTSEGHPAMVRQAAIEGLIGVKLTPTQATQLLDLVEDVDEAHVADPAIRALEEFEDWPAASAEVFGRLVRSRKPRVRLFALRAARFVPADELVKPLLNQLDHEDERFREAAVMSLGHNKAALEPLLRQLTTERDVDRARAVATALVPHGAALKPAQLKSLAEKGCKLLVGHDKRGEVILEFLVRARPEQGAEAVVDKAVKLRRQRKFAEAQGLLSFLASAGKLDSEGRYQLALARLLMETSSAGNGAGMPGDATMGHLAILVRDQFPCFERLKKESMLKPEDLLRIGRHFSERVGNERRFGAEVLHHVAEKHGRVRAGEEARLTLRSEGL